MSVELPELPTDPEMDGGALRGIVRKINNYSRATRAAIGQGGGSGTGTSLTSWSQVPKPSGGIPASDLDGTVLRVLRYSGGTYPARPTGLPGGSVKWIGPTTPTAWIADDEWVNNS
jgi:hypothetical protein